MSVSNELRSADGLPPARDSPEAPKRSRANKAAIVVAVVAAVAIAALVLRRRAARGSRGKKLTSSISRAPMKIPQRRVHFAEKNNSVVPIPNRKDVDEFGASVSSQ